MTKVRAVGFDLDGTLFDHRRSAIAGVGKFFNSLGVPPTPAAHRAWLHAEEAQFERWRTGEISFQEQRRERLRYVLPACGIDAPLDSAALDSLFEGYLLAYRLSWCLFADSISLLGALRSAGLLVGVLTNGAGEQQRDKLQVTNLFDALDVVCISEEIGVQKPDPIAFTELAGQLGVDPTECLFVGDHPSHDVDGAIGAGMQGLLVDRYGAHRDGITRAVLDELGNSRERRISCSVWDV